MVEEFKANPEHRDSTIVKKQVEALGVKVLRAKIDSYNPELIRLTVPTDTPPIAGEVRRELARGFNGLPIPTKTWVWFKKPTESKVSVTESKITVDTSSKDYKAGYNLAIQGRIAPAVPAWTDQGKADFAQGYKDGTDARSKPILTIKEPERIPLTEGEIKRLEKKLNVYAEQAERAKESEEFGKPIPKEPEKPRVIGAPTRQEQALREAREKSHEGMRLKGQQVLTSAVSTSKRLSEFEEKEKSMVSEEKKKWLEDAKTDLEVKLAEEARLKRELEEVQIKNVRGMMASKDVIGSPPNPIMKLQLQKLWVSIHGAIDILDFDTFMKNVADYSYQEAKERLIKEYGSPELESRYKQLEQESGEALQSGKEEFIEDELKRLGETGELVSDHIAELKAHLEDARRKLAEKLRRKPKLKPLEAFAPTQPSPTDYITKLCKQSPMNHTDILKLVKSVPPLDINIAIKIIRECPSDKLDDFDKYEIEELLWEKAEGIETPKVPTERELHKLLSPPAKGKPETKIRTTRDVSCEREGEEKLPSFQPVNLEIQHLNPQNARRFFNDYRKYLPVIFENGVQAWLEAHREAYKFSLTSHNIESLITALEHAIVLPSPVSDRKLADLRAHAEADPRLLKLADELEKRNRIPSVRERVAATFIRDRARQIIRGGISYASGQFNWQSMYDINKGGRKDFPDIETFKNDVLSIVRKGSLLSFD